MSCVDRSVFLFSFVQDGKTQFISLIIKPSDECKRVYNFIREHKNLYLDIFILGPNKERFYFDSLADLIEVDNDPDNIRQHEVRYPYWNLIDSYVAQSIYDQVLEMIG